LYKPNSFAIKIILNR